MKRELVMPVGTFVRMERKRRCRDCSRTDRHTHCPECGSTEHVAETCDMEG